MRLTVCCKLNKVWALATLPAVLVTTMVGMPWGFAAPSQDPALDMPSHPVSDSPGGGRKTFSAQVNFTADDVPAQMYGVWERTRFVRSSNVTAYTNRVEYGLWTISRVEDQVFLMNPENGVQANARVVAVGDSTATFELNIPKANGSYCQERLALRAEGNQLKGRQEKACYRPAHSYRPGRAHNPDMTERYFFAVADVEGRRTEETLLPLRNL